MSEVPPNDTPEEPSLDETQELLERARNLQDEINHYRDTARIIDDKFRRANEDKRLSLDDIPYGEELLRTEDLPDDLDNAIDLLTQIAEGKLSQKDEIIDAFDKAEIIIQDARDTIDDCTPLPSNNEDEENEDE